MRSGSGGGGGGDCGFKSAQGALESAVQSFFAKHSGAAEPGAGRTGQPAARYGDLELGSPGRGALSAPVRAVRPGDGRAPALRAARLSWAVLSRSRGGSPKVPGVLGAGSGLLRPRDRFVYKHWRALWVRDLRVRTTARQILGWGDPETWAPPTPLFSVIPLPHRWHPVTPSCAVHVSIEILGSGAHRPQKSRGRFGSLRPREPQRVPAWTLPGASPAALPRGGRELCCQTCCGGLCGGSLPGAGSCLFLLQVLPAWLLAPLVRVIFPKQWSLTPVSWLALSRGGTVPLDPLCKELPASSDFTFTHSF